MSQRLIISVDASKDNSEPLSVLEVFAHVIDLFQLIDESNSESTGKVSWRLVSATMNSPFTVVAEAFPARPNVPVARLAQMQKSAFKRNIAEISSGRVPPQWADPKIRLVLSRVIQRNRKSIGITKIDEDRVGSRPIVLNQDKANAAALSINKIPAPTPPVYVKKQFGSIEGKILQIGTHYSSPAILVEDRKSRREIWCLVPLEFQHEISESTKFEDVWRGRRVLVKGILQYSQERQIARVVATKVILVPVSSVGIEAFEDRSFTGGLSVSEYLEKFREGTLG